MERNLLDTALKITRALPAQNTTVTSSSIELGAGLPEPIQAQVIIPATPVLADGQTITVTLHDSADDSSFAAIPELATLVVTGAGGAGAAAATRTVYLPPSVRKFVRLSIAASATAGANTGVSAILQLRF